MLHSSPLRDADRVTIENYPPPPLPRYCKIPPNLVVRGLFDPPQELHPSFRPLLPQPPTGNAAPSSGCPLAPPLKTGWYSIASAVCSNTFALRTDRRKTEDYYDNSHILWCNYNFQLKNWSHPVHETQRIAADPTSVLSHKIACRKSSIIIILVSQVASVSHSLQYSKVSNLTDHKP